MDAVQPRVLINSLPKSGTHLLAKAVELCGFREHFADDSRDEQERVTPLFLNYREVKDAMAQQSPVRQAAANIPVGTLSPAPVDVATLSEWLAAIPAGGYLLGHMGWTSELAPLLEKQGVRHVFIIRDPRAVLASLLSFILDTKGMPKPHFLEADFKPLSPEQRLDLLLEGGEASQAGVPVTPFHTIFRHLFAWHQEPSCLLLKFEDLVGEQGGGSQQSQEQSVRRIANHLGKPFDDELAAHFGDVYNAKSRTFRKGSIDGWKHSLAPQHIERIQDYCQPLCREAGYV